MRRPRSKGGTSLNTLPQRRSPRLNGYDYTRAGAYFVTLCTCNRTCLFGSVVDGEVILTKAGKVAHEKMHHIPGHWHGKVELDAFVVMPNHVHAILVLCGTFPPAQKPSNALPTLGQIVGSYKSGVSRRVRQQIPELCVWQGRYHDHIIRNETDLNRMRDYVLHNPARWQEDRLFPLAQ